MVATVCLCLLVSACTGDSYSGAAPHYIDDIVPIPVNVFVGKPDSLQTKSTGVDYEDENAALSGTDVYVYAFRNTEGTDFQVTSRSDKQSCLVDGSIDEDGEFGGKKAHLTDINACVEWIGSDRPMYLTGEMKNVPYNFFAYYIDTLSLDNSKIHRSKDEVTLDVDLDGRMDIMTSKSVYSGEVGDVRPYSYMAASKGVVPTFTFHHRLAQLKFVAVPGTTSYLKKDEKTIYVQKIIVMAAHKARLIVAYKDDREHSDLVADEASIDSLALTEADGSPLPRDKYMVKLPPSGGSADTLSIGGSMLVAPSESYKAYILLKEINSQGTYEAFSYVDLVYPDGFDPGCSYRITLKLFGNMVIGATVQLIPWNYGGEINLPDYEKPE